MRNTNPRLCINLNKKKIRTTTSHLLVLTQIRDADEKKRKEKKEQLND